uniref:Putative secreted metalloprotease n=1 Tax=Ixodes ricinus TaxID=34613 RepID=A0A6B0VDA4_IXORI
MYLTALIIVSIAPAHADVVYPVLIESRSGSSQGAVRVTEDYIVNLEESSVLGENLFFTDTLNGEVTHELMDTTSLRNSVYENSEHAASFTITKTPTGIEMEGYLNFTHGIKPLRINDRSGRIPHKIFPLPKLEGEIDLDPEHQPTRDFTVTINNSRREQQLYFSRQQARVYSRPNILPVPVYEHLNESPQPRADAELPDVWRPKMYIMIDSSINEYLRGIKRLQVLYIVRLMNIVNAIYKKVTKPLINLQLVGIYRFQTKEDEPFIVEEGGFIEGHETLAAFGKFTNNTSFAKPADFYILLVGRRLRSNGTNSSSIRGLAYPTAVCLSGVNVGIAVEVPLLYATFATIAHEIGHLLGSTHDGMAPIFDGHPGAQTCNSSAGYIMGSRKAPPFRFSNCSEQEMQFTLRLRWKNCQKTESDYNFFNVTKEVAGSNITPEMYCQRINPALYVSAKRDICFINCTNKENKVKRYPAPFGYPCGNGKRCWYGNCEDITNETESDSCVG